MKSFFTLFISLMLGLSSFAQDVSQDSIYVVADVMPEYKDGGLDGFRKYVAQNYVVPDIVKTDLNGLIIVSLVVEPDGQLSTIQVLRDLGFGTGEEAVRVINTSEQWTPGFIKDKPVRVKLTLPLPIKVVAQTPLEDIGLTQDTGDGPVYLSDVVHVTPEYKEGGLDGFRRYLAKNYIVSDEVKTNLNGLVIVSFIVETDGRLSNIKAVRDLGYGTGEEAVRLVANSERWIPGLKNGEPVRVSYTLPIPINIKAPVQTIEMADYEGSMQEFIEMSGVKIYPKSANKGVMPEYPYGGIKGFRKYITKGFNVPKYIKEAKGVVIVSFVVDESGSISAIKVIKDIENTKGLSAEVVRLIKKSPKWKPANLDGKNVKVAFTLPIIFNIINNTIYESPGRNRIYNSNDFKNANLRAPKEFGPK